MVLSFFMIFITKGVNMEKAYEVILDQKRSYIKNVEVDEQGFTDVIGIPFNEACDVIINYCQENNYDIQASIWEVNKADGEENYNERVFLV